MPRKHRNFANRVQLVVDEVLHLLGQTSMFSADVARGRSLRLTRLEERVLMSASPMAMIAEVATVSLDASPFSIVAEAANDHSATTDAVDTANPAAQEFADIDTDQSNAEIDGISQNAGIVRGIELIVIDSRVQDADTLLESLLTTDRDVRLLRLDANSDGLSQITDKLEQLGNVSAVHLLTHGSDGEILLGSTVLNANTLPQHAPEFLAWQHSLTANADLLIYGCDVAGTVEGEDFVTSLAQLTAADVSASVDTTGSAEFGGNWDLEYATGVIETTALFTTDIQQNWLGKLAVINVTTFSDDVDGNVTSVANLLANKGIDGAISLREAILAVNAGSGGDTINLASGTYTLALAGAGEDAALSGDLDILKTMTILGTGSGNTIINANGIDRVFHILGANGQLTLMNVTVQGGSVGSGSGGGLLVATSTNQLTLNSVVVSGNSAAFGAGIDNAGTLSLMDVTISNNGNPVSTIQGGGLRNTSNATLDRVTFFGNQAGSGGGIDNDFGTGNLTLTNVTVSGNTAASTGGGLQTKDPVTITNSTFTLNTSATGGGIWTQTAGAIVSLKNTIVAGNTATSTSPDLNGNFLSSGNNLIGNGTGQSNLVNGVNGDKVGSTGSPINPLLAGLQNYGGQTQTHALLAGSLAINAGTTTGAPATDQRGNARVGAVDIGAYEASASVYNKVYWADFSGNRIQRANLDGSNVETVVSGISGPAGLAVDLVNGKIYWTEALTQKVRRANLDGTGIQDIATGIEGANSIALDLAGGKIYFTENGLFTNRIHRANLDGTSPQALVTTGLSSPESIQLDVAAGKMYWSDSVTKKIQKANLNGTSVTDVYSAASAPKGLSLDIPAGKIYWVEDEMIGTDDRVRSANMNGSGGITDLVVTGLQSPYGVIVNAAEGKVYWSDYGTDKIQRANLNGTGVEDVLTGIAFPLHLAFGIGAEAVTNTSPVITSNGGGPTASINIAENTTTVTTVTATDLDLPVQPLTYSISGGSDETKFTIDSNSGVLSFITAPDFESPSDAGGNNVYDVIVQVSDGTLTDTQAIAVTVTNSSTGDVLIAAKDTYIVSGSATLNYGASTSLVLDKSGGGLGNGRILLQFDLSDVPAGANITSASLVMQSTQNGGALDLNVYQVSQAWDEGTGNGTAGSSNWDERQPGLDWDSGGGDYLSPIIATLNTGSIGQHSWDITTLVSAWNDGNAVNYGLMLASPSSGSSTVTYDSSEGAIVPKLVVTFDTTNAAPAITSNGGGPTTSINIAENTTSVTTVQASDINLPAQTLTYSISGGSDETKFTIDSNSGVLSFITAPDFESPSDVGPNNVYEVTVQVSDGSLTDTQAITVTVTNVNDTPPVVTAGQSFAVSELATDGTSLGTLAATDVDGSTTFGSWAIVSGNNDGVFSINAATGELTVADRSNLNFAITPSYSLGVTVSDGVNTSAVQTVTVTVIDSPNNSPVANDDSYTVLEGGTLSQSVVPNWFNSNWEYRRQLTFNNSTGATNLINNAVLVKLHASAADAIQIDYSTTQNAGQDLRFVDSDGTVLAYEIEKWDESGYSYVWVKVPQIDAGSVTDSIFMYYGNSTVGAGQNSSGVWRTSDVAVFHMNVNGIDSSSNGNDGLTISVIASSGQVAGSGSFDGLNSKINAQSAASVDNIFVGGGAISAWINPVSWGEGGYGRIADKGTTTSGAQGWGFQVAGTTASNGYLLFESDFTVNTGRWETAPGTISLNVWQNVVVVYDNSSAANVPKIYVNGTLLSLNVRSTPAGVARSDVAQDLTIGNRSGASDRTFSGRIDEVRISSASLSADQINADYKTVAGTFITAGSVENGPGGLLDNDADVDGNVLTVSLVSGPVHAASFTLNPDGSFSYVHDGSETTADSFTYRVNDGSLTDTATVSLTITLVNDNTPVITSNGGGATAAINVAENTTAVTTVTATDADLPSATLTYSIVSVLDGARFTINSSTGVLSFITAPNYEVPADIGGNNVYDVTVQVTDGTLIDTQAIAVSVTNADESPTASAGGPYAILEGNSLTVIAGPGVDPEGLPLTYAWDIDGDGLFTDATGSTATLTWNQLNALPVSVNDDGVRSVALRVTDAGGNSTDASTTLTITNTAPTLTVTGNATTSSGTPYTINLASSDPGADTITAYTINWGDGVTENIAGSGTSATHTYSIAGGIRSITVTATDEDGTFAMTGGPLVVTVDNTPPSAPTLSNTRVASFQNRATVGTLSFTDPDVGDSHTWTVSDNRFRVEGSTLRLRPGQQLNPLTDPTVALTVTVTDSGGAAASTNFTIQVNNAPVSSNDVYVIDGTQQFSANSPSVGVLANDTDADGDVFTANLESGPTHATAFGLNPNGTFWYRATSGYSGIDTFTYRATDGLNAGEVTTVTLTVNQPATLSYDGLLWSIPEHQTLVTPLNLGVATVVDDGIGINTITLAGLDAALFTLDAGNNLFLNAGVTVDFDVKTQFEVELRLDDPSISGSPEATQTLIFTVQDLNEVPTSTALPDVTVLEDALPGTISTASAFFDHDGDALTHSLQVVSATPGLIKTITINSTTGVISYSLNANAFGTAVLRVTASDPSNASASQQFQLNVQSVNDAPVVQNYSASTLSGQTLNVGASGVLTTATDADFDALSLTLVSGAAHGTVVLQANGAFVYTPDADFFGVDTFRFVVSDGVLTSQIATASIQVIPIFGGSPGDSASSGSSGSGTQTSSSSSSGSGSSANGSSSTAAGNNGSANSGFARGSSGGSSNSTPGVVDPLMAGLLNPGTANTTGDNNDDEIVGILPIVEATAAKRIAVVTGIGESATDDRSESNDFTRRVGGASAAQDFDVMFSQIGTSDAFMRLNSEREILYRQLAARVDGQSDSVNEQLEQTTRFKGRVVGSVGVVTTGFSVGYLFWAVRLGTLASGLIAQVPAWSMLDPLLVIDGDQKDEDKESLENIMDRQQAKLEKSAAESLRDENT
jgi:hypothetical protein